MIVLNEKIDKRRPVVSGVIWLGLGLFLLSFYYDWAPDITRSWPVLIIAVGVAMIVGAIVRSRDAHRQNQTD